ncbi:MAG: hypothetical protein MUE58_07125 [Chitinophagaceae bacterium]|jgi:hypothetical protein|nr:hypothetical protein [Chitinophagaceae bacterium]
MPNVKTVSVRKGDWRTLETFFNAKGVAFFRAPVGATIKVRYGVGWLGKDRQVQKLDGQSYKKLEVGSWSVTRARMQVKVSTDCDITYYVDGLGVGVDFPEIQF